MTACTEGTSAELHLLALARSGDRTAFDRLINEHYRSCVNIATSILRDRSEAEDQVQQALWKAFRHLDQYLGDADFFIWLLRIIVNECRMLMRSKKRAQFLYINDGPKASEDRHAELLSLTRDPECQVVECEMIEVLRAEIQCMPPLFRNVILLRDVNGLTMAEVAEELGITISAAKSRLLRARNELRQRIASRFGPMRHMMPLSGKQILPARPVHSSFAA